MKIINKNKKKQIFLQTLVKQYLTTIHQKQNVKCIIKQLFSPLFTECPPRRKHETEPKPEYQHCYEPMRGYFFAS